jgi:co-chaperonin GroES (HSP10)
VQDRLPKAKTKGGILLTGISQDEDQLRMNIGRVAAIGPRAFTDEYGNEVEPDFAVGDYVRVPRYTQDRPVEGKEQKVAWRMLLPENISAVIVHIDAILR